MSSRDLEDSAKVGNMFFKILGGMIVVAIVFCCVAGMNYLIENAKARGTSSEAMNRSAHSIRYIYDDRTGLCYAQQMGQSYSITCVPCTAKVRALVRNPPETWSEE